MALGISLQSDFTAGELSPSLLARVDLAKYLKGCRTLRNFLVQPHGGAVKRPGLFLIGELPGAAALVEFVFNTEQAYCLAFGEKWLRVATHDGFIVNKSGEVYEVESPYTLKQAKELSITQSADVLFIACHGVPPTKLMRYGHANWRFEPMVFTSPVTAPAWSTQSLNFINGAKKSDGSHSAAQCITPYNYYITAIDANGKESDLSDAASITGPAANNWQGGDYIVLNWDKIEGAEEYRVYKSEFGGRPGYIATVGGLTYQDYNTSPSITEGAPKYIDPFLLKNDDGKDIQDYPGVVGLFEQRLAFTSTPRRPQNIWMSKSGDYFNFANYTPVTDDSPIELTIASPEVSVANWMIPLRSLILGTPGMEWEISGRGDVAFSGKSAKATPQSYWGSSLKKAMIVGNIILHVSNSGCQVRNLQYDFGSDSYGGTDLSILASHLFENDTIIDWAYQKNPDSIIWAVRSDGVLLGLTFQAEHQISAWHRHDTQGKFTAVCAVPNGREHALFAIVLREGVYFLERMSERYMGGDPSKAVFLDCALTYTGAATKTISGLSYLEGKEVGIFSQGAVEAPRKVRNGKITLDAPSTVVSVGLLYTADLETMPIEVMDQGGASVSLKKQISTINLSFHESLGVKAGLSVTPGDLGAVKWQVVKMRNNELLGVPPTPFSGVKHLTMPHSAENSLSVCIRSEGPTPVAIQSIMSRIEVKP